MKRATFIILFLSFCGIIKAQNTTIQKDSILFASSLSEKTSFETKNAILDIKATNSRERLLRLQLGYNYWYHNSLSIALLKGIDIAEGGMGTIGGHYWGLGADIANVGGKPLIIPKITFEASDFLLTVRGSIMYMTDFKKNGSFMIRPELGLSIYGTGVTLGYNFIPFKIYDQTPSYFVVSAQYAFFPPLLVF